MTAGHQACHLLRQSDLSDDLALDEKNSKIINVTDGTGLILLSNVRPADYCSGYTINLITTVGWNVTKSVEIAR